MENPNIVEIEYKKAKTHKRVFAFIIDIITLTFISTLIFGLVALINNYLPSYQEVISLRSEVLKDANLVDENDKDYILKIKNDTTLTYSEKNKELRFIIDNFYLNDNFFLNKTNEFNFEPLDKYLIKLEEYKIKGLDAFNVDKINRTYEETLTKNDESFAKTYFEFYYDEIQNNMKGYLIYNDDYLFSNKVILYASIGNLIFSTFLAYIFTFMMFPLIFKRGHQTLGMKVNKISYIFLDGFNVSNKRLIFKIFFSMIIEFYLSLIAFFIPFAISFSMALISSRGQSLSEYLFSIYVIDSETDTIYLDYGEYSNKTTVRDKASIENEEFKLENKINT